MQECIVPTRAMQLLSTSQKSIFFFLFCSIFLPFFSFQFGLARPNKLVTKNARHTYITAHCQTQKPSGPSVSRATSTYLQTPSPNVQVSSLVIYSYVQNGIPDSGQSMHRSSRGINSNEASCTITSFSVSFTSVTAAHDRRLFK